MARERSRSLLVLAHWNEEESNERLGRLERAGHRAIWGGMDGSRVARLVREEQPAAVVIDLGRLPSHGRELGMFLRQSPRSRGVPLVFVDGASEKVARVQATLPDAVFCTWRGIAGALKRALARRNAAPVVPRPDSGFGSGMPLVRKLGIKPGTTVALPGAPEGFESVLGELPGGVTLRRQARGAVELAVWFVRSRRELERSLEARAAWIGGGILWIAWPKRTSALHCGLTQDQVRQAGLTIGLVDSKICAVDADWSALRFTRRTIRRR